MTTAIVTIERSRGVQASFDHTVPQAPSVMKLWKGASNGVVPALARSTCVSPSTRRRVVIPLR